MESNNIYAKINAVRFELSKDLNKSGKNSYSKYDYFQLKDFMPKAIEECNKQGLFTKFWIDKEKQDLPSKKVTQYMTSPEGEKIGEIVTEEFNFQYVEYAYLLVVDVEDGTEELFKKETREVTLQASQPIQNLGGKSTYMKRYMYMDVFEINENDKVEDETGAPTKVEVKEVKTTKKPAVKTVATKAPEVTPYSFEPTPAPVTPTPVAPAPVAPTPTEIVNSVSVDLPKTAPVESANPEDLMSMETKIELANVIKENGLDPRTEIVEIARELGTDVPFLKETDKDKIVEIIKRKAGK